jgi:hypothetical protein
MKLRKCVIVGDGAVRKTYLLSCDSTTGFSDEYLAILFDN